jgi:hypothetical protein
VMARQGCHLAGKIAAMPLLAKFHSRLTKTLDNKSQRVQTSQSWRTLPAITNE